MEIISETEGIMSGYLRSRILTAYFTLMDHYEEDGTLSARRRISRKLPAFGDPMEALFQVQMAKRRGEPTEAHEGLLQKEYEYQWVITNEERHYRGMEPVSLDEIINHHEEERYQIIEEVESGKWDASKYALLPPLAN